MTVRHAPELFSSMPELSASLETEAKVSRIVELMSHFNMTRKRVDRAEALAGYFGKTGTTGKVSKHLNKLNQSNYVVVSHGIFRLLVDDSSVLVESVFDHIMEYASNYDRNSALLARVCADLARFYVKLSEHITRRIKAAHDSIISAVAQLRTQDGSSYTNYLTDVGKRRAACGIFVFVCHLHEHGVVDASLIETQWSSIATIVGSALRDIVVGDRGWDEDDSKDVGEPLQIQDDDAILRDRIGIVDAYCECLRAMIREGSTRLALRASGDHSPVLQRYERMLWFICGAKRQRPTRFPARSWYGLIDLRDLVLNAIESDG